LGATWIDADYIQQFMEETFETPYYLRRSIEVKFSELTAEWRINGKSSPNYNDVAAYVTYGTERANAYRILEETLNLKDIRIYDTIEDADGKQKRVLNKKETTLAQQKQQAIKDAFEIGFGEIRTDEKPFPPSTTNFLTPPDLVSMMALISVSAA
jgi:N12 class adenine-specific DNA methylase